MVLAFGVLLALGLPAALYAHLALASSSPGAGETLAVAPTEVVLTFTEPVELALSSLVVVGPGGEVELGELEAADGGMRLRAAMLGQIVGGEHTVRWQAVGSDGHPVRGEFVFLVPDSVIVPASPQPAPTIDDEERGGTVAAPAPPVAGAFDAQSPLYAIVRWLNYAGIVGSTGAAAFLLLLLRLGRRPEAGLSTGFQVGAGRATLHLGFLAVLLVGVALTLRLQAQSHAVFGGGVDARTFSLLMSSAWGRSWLVEGIGAAAVLAGLGLGLRRLGAGAALAAAGAVLLSFSPALSGHAAAVESAPLLAIAADGLHVLAAGAWLGSLFAFVVVGVPHLRRIPSEDRPAAYSTMLLGFSAMALVSGGVLLATGLFSTTLHLEAPADLWRSAYGRLLLAKLLLVATVFAAGAFNWRRLPYERHRPGAESSLRRNGAIELTAALVVIGLTAILVAIPPPASAIPPPGTAVAAPSGSVTTTLPR